MKKIIFTIITLLLLLLLRTLYYAGTFKSIDPQFAGNEIMIYDQMAGPEDFQVDYQENILYISSSDRRNQGNDQDGIYLLHLGSDNSSPLHMSTDITHPFHPHGISLYREDSTLYLMAVNHNEKGDFIEIFQVDSTFLTHIESVSDSENMCCPNDVVAVGKDQFYVTNDHGSQDGLMRTLEDYLILPFANIQYYDGKVFRKVHGGMRYANGINVSPDRNFLFAAETTGRKMLTFKRNKTDGSIQKIHSLSLGTGIDNLDIDAAGNIWTAAHPKMLAFVGHAKDAEKWSPSQVLKISPEGEYGTSYHVKEIMMDDGSKISASSVALQYQDEVWVGVVFDNVLFRGELTKTDL